jgi:beta-xylosidase
MSVGATFAADTNSVYLFSYFRCLSRAPNGEAGLFLAASTNGLNWTELKAPKGETFLEPRVGGNLMRDPCLRQGPDGVFRLVWTAVGGGPPLVFGYASSTDLVHWSEEKAVPVMENEPTAQNVWAPELFYDDATPQWLIFWATTIPGKFPETKDSGDNNHRIYYVSTKDFTNFSPTKLLYDGGFNVIDATMLKDNGKYYLFVKDETKNPVKKNLRMAVGAGAEGPFGPASEAISTNWVEGPSAIKIGAEYFIYFDHYASPQYYGAIKSPDLTHWRDISATLSFPAGSRHGTISIVPASVVRRIDGGFEAENATALPADNDKSNFGRALIPDLVADPRVVDLDGTFYCYATTDVGEGLAASGTPVVWTSKDFLNWSFEGCCFPSDFDLKYWAPSSIVHKNGRYYSFPTLDEHITVVTADSPAGPFLAPDGKHVTRANHQLYPINPDTIDAEVFVDDDGQAYMVWQLRHMVKLKPDLLSPDGPTITIPTKRDGYSEGPFLTRRKGIYYYFYTLSGDEGYQYAYMMSRTSPLGPWEAPEQDIISTTDHAGRVFGPGHGCFFHPKDSEQWYFVYLEYGRAGSTRQIYADKMNFNADGTIQPIKLTKAGVGALRPGADPSPNLALNCKATTSSTHSDYRVPPRKDPTLDRVETYAPANALDGFNGTRWLADLADSAPWFQVDLGAPRDIQRTEAYFTNPTAGHAYRLEWSLDGQAWQSYGEHDEIIRRSPHRDARAVRARYLKLTILKGEPGLWEFRVY